MNAKHTESEEPDSSRLPEVGGGQQASRRHYLVTFASPASGLRDLERLPCLLELCFLGLLFEGGGEVFFERRRPRRVSVNTKVVSDRHLNHGIL